MPRWRQTLNVIQFGGKGKYAFSPANMPTPATDLNHNDWLIVQFLPGRVPEGLSFQEVRFYDKPGPGRTLQSTWRKQEGQWARIVSPGTPSYFEVEDAVTQRSPGAIKITNIEEVEQGKEDSHEFEVTFSDGGCLDPQVINRGGGG